MAITKVTTPELIDLSNNQLVTGVSTTYNITVISSGGNKYAVNGVQQPDITLIPGTIYIINQDDSTNNAHPLILSTSSGAAGVYSTGVTYSLNGANVSYASYISGFAAATQRRLTINLSSPPTLSYICYYHSGMGSNVSTTPGTANTDGVVLPKGSTVPGSVSVEYLAVAGGGGTSNYNGGGGGAGGLLNASITMNDNVTYTIVIGEGGALSNNTEPSPATSNGDDSTLNGSDITLVTVTGGGKGGLRSSAAGTEGGDGGSGGGGGSTSSTGATPGAGNTPSTSPSQGFAGGVGADGGSYRGGGGGGAGAAGGSSASGGSGGVGLDMSAVINNTNAATASVGEVSGSTVYFAGGGGAGANSSAGSGGLGGGGDGGTSSPAGQGTEGTGGGGGGGSYPYALNAAKGGRGVVILRYDASRTVTTSGFTAEAGPYTEGDYKVLVLKQGTGTVTFSGTPTVGRPVTGGSYILEDGEFRYNTVTKKVEYYDGVGWFTLDSTTVVPQAGTTGVCNYPTTAVALYQFESNGNDTCGNWNSTSEPGITYFTPGKFGYAANFTEPSGVYLPKITPITNDVSVSGWLRLGSTTTSNGLRFIEINATTVGWSGVLCVFYAPSNGEWKVRVGDGSSSETTVLTHIYTLTQAVWYNVCVTRNDSSNVTKLYINGSEVDSETISATPAVQASAISVIGRYVGSSTGYSWVGDMDQIRLFSSVLTSDQVTALAEETAP